MPDALKAYALTAALYTRGDVRRTGLQLSSRVPGEGAKALARIAALLRDTRRPLAYRIHAGSVLLHDEFIISSPAGEAMNFHPH